MTGNSHSTLSEFGVETGMPTAESVANSAVMHDVPEERDIGPFETTDTEYGLRTRLPKGTVNPPGPSESINQYGIRWIVDGNLTEYVRKHGDGDVWMIPDTYAGFSDIDTYVSFVDSTAPEASMRDCQYGWGIDGNGLEAAFRALSGGGRYQASNYKVIPCRGHPYIVTGPEGSLLVSPGPISRPSDPSKRPTSTISGSDVTLDVEEENQRVLNGMARLVTALEKRSLVPTEHVPPAGDTYNSHEFHLESDDTVRVSTGTLLQLASLKKDPDTLTVEPPADQLNVSPDSIDIDTGWSGPHDALHTVRDDDVLVGWRFEWDSPTTSPELCATVKTHWLTEEYFWRLQTDTYRLDTTPQQCTPNK